MARDSLRTLELKCAVTPQEHDTCLQTIADLRQKLATLEWQRRGLGGVQHEPLPDVQIDDASFALRRELFKCQQELKQLKLEKNFFSADANSISQL